MKLREIMSTPAVTVDADSPVTTAARLMRDSDIGDVIVLSNGNVTGMVTDRDLAVRVVASGRDPAQTMTGEVASTDVHSLSPDDDVEKAIALIREFAVRRIPILEGDEPVGIVTIGDLAIERDDHSALADVSAAPPNN
jgi:CBS domain-containing protein